ncbi:MAG TPA: hypothetical protein VK599_08885, partial [Streptosporangiaceae bacterium]|nr:hypothetical protein [Streptosporangiaceae bacterium]
MSELSADGISTGGFRAGEASAGPAASGAGRRERELPGGRYGLRGAVGMEWIRLRSLRSTWWITGLVIVSMIGLAILVLRYYPGHWAQLSAPDKASFDPTEDGYAGLGVAQLAAGVLGILAATGEYASGMIRSTLTAVPRRGLVLAAKAAVVGA